MVPELACAIHDGPKTEQVTNLIKCEHVSSSALMPSLRALENVVMVSSLPMTVRRRPRRRTIFSSFRPVTMRQLSSWEVINYNESL